MTTNCTRCESTGFLNLKRTPDGLYDRGGVEAILNWINNQTRSHDVQVCDCCGNGETWYGDPGCHYGPSDPPGIDGPYGYNGGCCECH